MRSSVTIPFNQSIVSKMKPKHSVKRLKAEQDAETVELEETTSYNGASKFLKRLNKDYFFFKFTEPDAKKLKIVEEAITETKVIMHKLRMKKSS